MTLRFLLIALLAGSAWAQPAFEAASIRPTTQGARSIDLSSKSIRMQGQTLLECLRWSYNTQSPMILGPSWLTELRFDIAAATDTGTTEAEMRLMMQQLLAERFKLVLHRESRVLSILELTVVKGGHKMVPTDTEGSPSFRAGSLSVRGAGATMQPLVETISTFLATPVVDSTGLQGKFNYTLDINSFITDEVRRSAAVQLPVVVARHCRNKPDLNSCRRKLPSTC
ncbi:MAG: TIGR03435 family protein [Acidobacteriota bacterium]